MRGNRIFEYSEFMLKKEEQKRYARHLSLEQVGEEGQHKLKSARVLVVGAGGLGAPVLQYLTAAGVECLGIMDFDTVDESNLQRQVIFRTSDIGKYKAEAAAVHLNHLNPFVNFVMYKERLSSQNALTVFQEYDIIIDGTDNFPTRYLVNDACIILDKPFVHGSIFKFQGQVSVFNYKNGPSYRCLYPEVPNALEAPNCAEVGVLGVLPGMIGTQMASECLKMILGIGTILSGEMEVIDILENKRLKLTIQRNESNFKRTTLDENYDSVVTSEKSLPHSLSVHDLNARIATNEELIILDVRERFELEICAFPDYLHIPLSEIPSRANQIPRDKPVVIACHHGIRSAHAIAYLEENGFDNLSNLEGGIHAWAVDIDPQMSQY